MANTKVVAAAVAFSSGVGPRTERGEPSSSVPRGEQAIRLFHAADEIEAEPRMTLFDHDWNPVEARRLRAQADALLPPPVDLQVSAGEAVTMEPVTEELSLPERAHCVETLEHPTVVTAGASGHRIKAARDAGVLQLAIDAAQTAQAANSLEKMLCHQMAAAHDSAMRLFEHSRHDTLPPVEVARFTNAAARMMDVYQAGCLTLLKLKTRGTQRVLVQHQQVNVGPGGQAIVAGELTGESRDGGVDVKNGE